LQNNIKIKSATGDYSVIFNNKIDDFIADNIDFSYCIIDRKVWALYSETELFKKIHNPIFIDALETKKTVETALVNRWNWRRDYARYSYIPIFGTIQRCSMDFYTNDFTCSM
jgi:hypothetical protein